MEKEKTFQELCEEAHQRELAYNREMDTIIHAEEKAYLAHIRESLGSLIKEEKNDEESNRKESKIAQRKEKGTTS